MKELDTSGFNCPIPIIKAKKELRDMEIGESLKVISTDPGAVDDIKSLCDALNQELVSAVEEDNKFIFVIKRK
jgi:tRNA 2-thiouridine synthesizing protein A|tara:strand:- start:773 stop:991 length:219 start_codon:yes stop_codon:yes gene_type:complete